MWRINTRRPSWQGKQLCTVCFPMPPVCGAKTAVTALHSTAPHLHNLLELAAECDLQRALDAHAHGGGGGGAGVAGALVKVQERVRGHSGEGGSQASCQCECKEAYGLLCLSGSWVLTKQKQRGSWHAWRTLSVYLSGSCR